MSHFLQGVRDYYLDSFEQSIAEAKEQFDQFATELLLEIPSLKYPEQCYRRCRVDIIGKQAGKDRILEVNVKAKKPRLTRNTSAVNLQVDGALVWNGLEFRVTGTKPPAAELIAWTNRWLDPTDDRLDDSRQFQEVVHSVSPPEGKRSGYELSVDFGSAPTEAFDELVSVLARDAAKISVGSFSYTQSTAKK